MAVTKEEVAVRASPMLMIFIGCGSFSRLTSPTPPKIWRSAFETVMSSRSVAESVAAPASATERGEAQHHPRSIQS